MRTTETPEITRNCEAGTLPEDGIRIFVDAASRAREQCAGIAVILIDAAGQRLLDMFQPIDYRDSVAAELAAIEAALDLAEQFQIQGCTIYCDCKFAVDRVNGTGWGHDLATEQSRARIQARLERSPLIRVCYLHRDYNRDADWLAKLGAKGLRYWGNPENTWRVAPPAGQRTC